MTRMQYCINYLKSEQTDEFLSLPSGFLTGVLFPEIIIFISLETCCSLFVRSTSDRNSCIFRGSNRCMVYSIATIVNNMANTDEQKDNTGKNALTHLDRKLNKLHVQDIIYCQLVFGTGNAS